MPSSTEKATVVGVDVGGTFTDFVAVLEDGELQVHKVLSTPLDPSRAVLQGLAEMGIGRGVAVVHGSTVATNAVLERKGARTALVTTKGFEDVIEIGRQNRSSLYDFMASRPEPLVPQELRFGAPERLDWQGEVIRPLEANEAEELAGQVALAGAESIAVCFLFSFLKPDHEIAMKEALEAAGAAPHVYVSSEVLPEFREYERTSTTAVNAYVAPVVHRYLGRLRDELGEKVRIMQSSGGSTTLGGAMGRPVETISGGPAAGVGGAYDVARVAGFENIICFDMGGTSTDVALCRGGVPQTTEWSLGGLPVRTPAVDVYSVGAGGGSIARLDAGGALQVGPQSAGADPGPSCYGRGTLPTVTDANLVLGRLDTGNPLGGGVSLEVSRSKEALGALAAEMRLGLEGAAEGVLRVADAHMERAVRVISVARGHDPRDFSLVAFGGAGPMHACSLAEALGVPRVLIPLHPGVLSAQGMTVVDISREYSATVMLSGESLNAQRTGEALRGLTRQGQADLQLMGVETGRQSATWSLDMRYLGQSHELNVAHREESLEQTLEGFHAAHEARYGHAFPSQPVQVVNARVRVSGSVPKPHPKDQPQDDEDPRSALSGEQDAFFDGSRLRTPVYGRAALRRGNVVAGPALVAQYDSTAVIPPGWRGRVGAYLDLVVTPA